MIVVVPGRRKFHVWGDRAIHERVGADFWAGVAQKMSERFRAGEFTEGLLAGIEETGATLAALFPRPSRPADGT